jgi:flavin reductase (DIM6/NTAB) family NADH-FMN oxidoreductase RutF
MDAAASELTAHQRYKLLVSLIVPRPIAWTTTLNPAGSVNVAPFSFFNVLGDDPPLVIISMNPRPGMRLKDTLVNAQRTGEWVVNIVDEALAETMHKTSAEYPAGVSEAEATGLALAPSKAVKPPCIRDVPFSLECRLRQVIEVGETRRLLLGEGVHFHVRDDIFDPATFRIRGERFFPVGRFYGNRYTRTRDQFELPPAVVPE